MQTTGHTRDRTLRPRLGVLAVLCVLSPMGFEESVHAAAESAAGSPLATADGAPVVEPARCQACHQGPLKLDRYSAEDLVLRIEELRADPVGHPPLELERASSEAIEALAKALVTP